MRKVLRPTSFDERKQILLVRALLVDVGQAGLSGAEVPEEHPEGVDVDAVVVVAGQQLGRHVDWRPHHAAGHHHLHFAEPEVGQFGPVLFVQLRNEKVLERFG